MDRHIFHRIFARDEYRLDGVAPGAWDTVVDVGAHIGIFAVRVAPLARRVLCYEPDPGNHALLSENTGRLGNVVAFRKALAAGIGTAALFVSPNPSAHSLCPEGGGCGGESVTVETVSLESVFAEHGIGRCDLLKLDCEGAEYDVLYATPAALWRGIERVAMEYHPAAARAPERTAEGLARFLSERGHEVEVHPSRKNPAKGHLFSRRRR